jgi:hypothetical protein
MSSAGATVSPVKSSVKLGETSVTSNNVIPVVRPTFYFDLLVYMLTVL